MRPGEWHGACRGRADVIAAPWLCWRGPRGHRSSKTSALMLMSGNLLQHPLVCKHWAQNATIPRKADSSNHPHVPRQGSSPQGSTLGASLNPIRAAKVASRNPVLWSLCSVAIMNHKTSLMSGLSLQPTWNYTAIRVWNLFNRIQKMVGIARRVLTTLGKL